MKRILFALLVVSIFSAACKKETPGPTPDPTPVVEPTAPPSATLCRETEMVSGAPVSYCFQVAVDGAKTPVQCPEAGLSDVPFCQ